VEEISTSGADFEPESRIDAHGIGRATINIRAERLRRFNSDTLKIGIHEQD